MKKGNHPLKDSDESGGRISKAVVDLLRRQVADRGIVIWYDPQKAYTQLASRLVIEGVSVFRFEDSFFRLRDQLEPLLDFVNEKGTMRPDSDVPPRVIVYVPLGRMETYNSLIEVETAGVVVEPYASRAEQDSRLGRFVEVVFKEVAPAKAQNLARQSDEGLLTLDELDRMALEAVSTGAGALQVVFGNVSAEEMLLLFVASGVHDEKIAAKLALPEIARLAESELGLASSPVTDARSFRIVLRRYILVSELLIAIPEDQRPDALSGLVTPENPANCDSISYLCRHWRNRLDLQDAFADAAVVIERELSLSLQSLPLDALESNETFSMIEHLWIERAVSCFAGGVASTALEIANKRIHGFWPRKLPELQLGWRVIESAAELSLQAERVEKALRQRKWTLVELVEAYTHHAEPWMRLDRLARELETRHARWEAAGEESGRFEIMMAKARERYATVAAGLAEAYADRLQAAMFDSGGLPNQAETFRRMVSPALEKGKAGKIGKTAFLMVDALRYEMAAQLIEGLERDFDVSLEPVLGQLPGITQIGMASLLPGAESGLSLEHKSGGLDVRIRETSVSSRKDRIEWLIGEAGDPICVCKLADVLKPSFKRRKDFSSAHLVVVTSQEIDLLGEEGDEEGIRLYLDDVLEKLRRGIRALARSGVKQFVVASDHGFLYLHGGDPGLRMDPPGGQTAELHSRVWIGEGGVSDEGYFRMKASELALGGPFDVAFPRGLAMFKVKGGASDYFHGGISPPEHILPVTTLTVRKGGAAKGESRLMLSIAKPAITNRLFSITAELAGEGLFPDT